SDRHVAMQLHFISDWTLWQCVRMKKVRTVESAGESPFVGFVCGGECQQILAVPGELLRLESCDDSIEPADLRLGRGQAKVDLQGQDLGKEFSSGQLLLQMRGCVVELCPACGEQVDRLGRRQQPERSEEHTSELQSRFD